MLQTELTLHALGSRGDDEFRELTSLFEEAAGKRLEGLIDHGDPDGKIYLVNTHYSECGYR